MIEDSAAMLEPDVALTDFALAVLCAALATALLLRTSGDRAVRRVFAALFAALGLAALLGGLWHGFYSAPAGRQAPIIWTLTLATLGVAASVLWAITARLARSHRWRKWLSLISFAQFPPIAFVVLFFTQTFSIVGVAMLPPVAVLAGMLVVQFGKSRSRLLLLGLAGLVLVVVASALQQLGISLSAVGLSSNGLYHVLQAAAFILIFLSVPAVRSGTEGEGMQR